MIDSDWYVWMDSSIKPLEGIDLADEIIQQAGDNSLCLFLHSKGNSIREEAKRTVERSVNPENVRMQCGSVDAIIEDDNGRMRVVKIIKDKYGDYAK